MPTLRKAAKPVSVTPATWAIRVASIEQSPDRLKVHVELSQECFCYTSTALIAALLPVFPNLLEHACVNDKGDTFRVVAANTSTPHLLEHMVIDEQSRRDASPSKVVFVGKTTWENRARRQACVQLSFADAALARQAVQVAVRALNDALLRAFAASRA